MLTEVRGASKKEAMGHTQEKEPKNVGKRKRERERKEERDATQRQWTRLMHNSCVVPSTYIFVFKYLNTSFAAIPRGRAG